MVGNVCSPPETLLVSDPVGPISGQVNGKEQKINDHQVAGIFHGTMFQQNKATPKVKALINALIPTFTSPIVEAAKKSFYRKCPFLI